MKNVFRFVFESQVIVDYDTEVFSEADAIAKANEWVESEGSYTYLGVVEQ